MPPDPLRKRLRSWLADYFSALRTQRNLSPNTIASYKDTWRLLLAFGASQHGMPASGDWRLGQVHRQLVLGFLDHVETARGCSAVTRNLRLAAIQSFFTWVRGVEPGTRDHCERILAIQGKRTHRPVIGCLEADELRAVMDAVDLARPDGMRDFALLCFAYNTGARVHETAALRKDWLSWHGNPTVRICGKGNKQRELPPWDGCAQVLRLYLAEHRRRARSAVDESFVFIGQRGDRMTRFGVARVLQEAFKRASGSCPSLRRKHLTAHSMRHTTALHLLQNGADLVTIQNWLGHETLDSVRTYLSLDLKAKREILQRCLSLDYVVGRLHEAPGDHEPPDEPKNWLDKL